jgi:hypothetical protein
MRVQSHYRRHLDCSDFVLSPLFGYLLCFYDVNKILSTKGASNMRSSFSGAGKKRK